MSASASIALLEALAAIDETIGSLTGTLAQSEGRLQKLAADRASLELAREAVTVRQHEEEAKKRAIDDEVRNLARQVEMARDRQFRVHKLVDVQTVEREREDLQRLSRDKRSESEQQDELLASLGSEVDALAKAFGGRCHSCQMALPPTFFQKLRRDAILDQCPSCQRLIYAATP